MIITLVAGLILFPFVTLAAFFAVLGLMGAGVWLYERVIK